MKVTTTGIVVFCAVLAGCGGGTASKGPATAGGGQPSFRSLSVTGSYVDANRAATPISAAMNSGKFTLNWDVRGVDLYHVKFYFNDQSDLGGQPVHFVGWNCGAEVAVVSGCNQSGSVECQFTPDNRLTCGSTSAGSVERFVSSGLPVSGFIVAQACEPISENCAVQAVKVDLE